MPSNKSSLLIVDDNDAIQFSLSVVLREIGYRVRTAEDGFSALAEIRKELPEIVLSDLNMPGMSGFELLAVLRQSFPSVRTIAMSASFGGDEAPSGVVADAFYQKGSSMVALLQILENLAAQERGDAGNRSEQAPAWIVSDGHGAPAEIVITVSCPECLRTFSHVLNQPVSHPWQGVCTHCKSVIHLASMPSADKRLDAVCREQSSSASPDCQPLQTTDCK